MYTPSSQILANYADVLVNFALNSGEGIKSGEVVYVSAPEIAKPLYAALIHAIIDAGGHYIGGYHPSVDDRYNIGRDFYEQANPDQITFFPEKYYRGLIDQIDHQLMVIADTDKQALKGIDPQKIMAHGKAMKPYMEWRDIKEGQGKFTWTLGLYATEASAKEASMSLEEYWQQIIQACYLDTDNPVEEWRSMSKQVEEIKNWLNDLKIETVHIHGEDADLRIKIGQHRAWMGGSGRNIPSYELFTSPDWRGTQGWIRFNQPLYRYGNLITGIELTFKQGRVVQAKAKENEAVLKEMIATEGADKLGEFSLTDARFSRITRFMAETLFDENIGGEFGNTHVALGKSYHDCYSGNPADLNDEKLAQDLGYNDSSVHTDVISTTNRTVTATLPDGSHKIIYRDGQFQR